MPLSTKVLGVGCPDEPAQANTSIVSDTKEQAFLSQSFTASSNLPEKENSHLRAVTLLAARKVKTGPGLNISHHTDFLTHQDNNNNSMWTPENLSCAQGEYHGQNMVALQTLCVLRGTFFAWDLETRWCNGLCSAKMQCKDVILCLGRCNSLREKNRSHLPGSVRSVSTAAYCQRIHIPQLTSLVRLLIQEYDKNSALSSRWRQV